MLGLALINYFPAAGGALPIIILATGIGQLLATVWSAALGQSAVAAVFGGFWLSYAALLVGLTHGWWGVTPAATIHTVAAFLISWIVIIAVLTLAGVRLPSAFTLIFVLVEVALILVLAATVNGSSGLGQSGRNRRIRIRRGGSLRVRRLAQRRHRRTGPPARSSCHHLTADGKAAGESRGGGRAGRFRAPSQRQGSVSVRSARSGCRRSRGPGRRGRVLRPRDRTAPHNAADRSGPAATRSASRVSAR